MKLPSVLSGTILIATVLPAPAGGFSEPPAILYGRVIHVDAGATFQVFDGDLALTLTNERNPENSVTVTGPLTPSGEGGVFSYRLAIPQQYLPPAGEQGDALAVDGSSTRFGFESITVDGMPAVPLDPAQSLFTTSFSQRDQEHRLDLKVSLPQDDTDRDGLPDWWEELHGLNPLFAGDSTTDADADGIDALGEFRGGTDPNANNTEPSLVSTTLDVPEGGTSGLVLSIVDSDTAAADLDVTVTSAVAGLTLRDSSGPLTPPATFTYAEVLDGEIVIDVAFGTAKSSVPITITDTTGANTPIPFTLFLTPFSPADQGGVEPAVWLEPSALAGAISEWPDRSPNGRDGFQLTAGARANATATGVTFDGTAEFLYLDDKRLDLSTFSAFFAFQADRLAAPDQLLFRGGGLDLRVGGSADPVHTGTLVARRPGQMLEGPPIQFGATLQTTLHGSRDEAFFRISGGSLYAPTKTGGALPASYATIGAGQTISAASASQFFTGMVHEIVLFDSPLDASQQSRLEDYQLSRWTGMVVWDTRNATSPQMVTGHPGARNTLSGGWGEDILTGAALADILRGGPGKDRLTGNDGADRFQIFPGHDDDTVTDFSEVDGDIIDLTPVFAGVAGTPGDFLNFRTELVRNGGAAPTVNSVLEIDYDGGLDRVDQSVTLEGVALSNADLPRLVGSGAIQLGGPVYPTALSIYADESALTETVRRRTLTLTRTGNLDAPLDLTLSFVGSATPNEDYVISGTVGTGALRSVSFAPGVSELAVGITPVQDTFAETETVEVAVLPSPYLTGEMPPPLVLPLADAPLVSVQVLRRYAERLGSVPALVLFHRTGDLGAPLDVALQFDGGAANGHDYLPVSPALSFPAGVASVEVEVTPSDVTANFDRPLVAQISVLPDPARYALESPWTGSVMILDGVDGAEAKTFAAFREDNFPGNGDSDSVLGTSDPDSDFLSTLGEYAFGTDPNAFNNGPEISVKEYNSAGFVEIHLVTAAGLADAAIELQFSANLASWLGVGDEFIVTHHWLGDGRLRRVYRSRLSAANLNNSGYYRAAVTQLPVPDLLATAADAAGAADQALVATSGAAWVPTEDGSQLEAPASTETGDISEFETFVDGASTVSFEWSADAGHRVEFEVDGVPVASVTGTMGFVAVEHAVAGDGVHVLRWRIEKLAGAASEAVAEAIRGLAITQP